MTWRKLIGRGAVVASIAPIMLASGLSSAALAGQGQGNPTTRTTVSTETANFSMWSTTDTTVTDVYVEAGDHWYTDSGDTGPYISVSEETEDITTPEPTVVSGGSGILSGPAAHVSFGRKLSSATVEGLVPMEYWGTEGVVPTPVVATWTATGRAMRDSEHYTQGIPGVWTTITSGRGDSRVASATLDIGGRHYQSESPETDYAAISSWNSISHIIGNPPY